MLWKFDQKDMLDVGISRTVKHRFFRNIASFVPRRSIAVSFVHVQFAVALLCCVFVPRSTNIWLSWMILNKKWTSLWWCQIPYTAYFGIIFIKIKLYIKLYCYCSLGRITLPRLTIVIGNTTWFSVFRFRRWSMIISMALREAELKGWWTVVRGGSK